MCHAEWNMKNGGLGKSWKKDGTHNGVNWQIGMGLSSKDKPPSSYGIV